MRRIFLPSFLLLVLATGCSQDDAAGAPSNGQGGSAGAAGGSSPAGASGTSLAGSSGGAGTVAGGAGGGAGGGADASTSSISLGLFNVVTAEIEPGFEKVGATLERVELPPRFTLVANVPAGTQSVKLTVDGNDRVDSAAPFRWTEDSGGMATAWKPTFGSHDITVVAYADAAASGAPLATLTQKIDLRGTGMDAAFVPTDQATNNQWVTAHLNEVMQPKTFTGTVGMLPYRLFTPAKYDAGVAYPVLVYLHGRGERGTDNRQSLYASQLFHGPNSIVSPNAQSDFPSFVIVPQCSDMPVHQEWAHWIGNSATSPFTGLGSDGSYQQAPDPWPSAQLVKELVASLQTTMKIEPKRIYLTGESMGGFGTWEFTTRWPEVFAVGVPMAGYSDRTKVNAILDIPFWVFHSTGDMSNPVAGSRAMVKAIMDAGGKVKYTEYTGISHGETFNRAWTQEAELLPFIYSQRKRK